ncbi:MAG: 16S rRNA (guanine(527)-N(7))-methyltransferase RsmG [Pseudomonadota bacterium]
MTPDEVRRQFHVPRETMARLSCFAALLRRWTAKINLISNATVADIWGRHIADSLQLFALSRPDDRSWIDMGAGGGLPGMIIAAAAAEMHPSMHVTLIEADHRKAAFLWTAARALAVDVTVLDDRIEAITPRPFDVVSARALAPLPTLLSYAQLFSGERTICLFPKGARHKTELTLAEVDWHIDCEAVPSVTDPTAAILKIREFSPRHDR